MGFEQLAALKAQLTKEAKLKKQQEERAAGKPAPAAKQGGKPAAKHGAKPAGKHGEKPAPKADRPARAGVQARPGEKTPPVDPVVRVIGKLQKRFPAAFPKNPAPKVPLKVGVLADLLAQAADLQLSEAEIREAVSTWCRGSRYWACLTDGAARVDLSGAPAGTVTARDAAFARNQAKGGPGGRRKPQHGKASAGQASAGQASAGQASDEETKADQTNAAQAKAGQTNADQANADQANADQANVDQANADQANADQANADQANADQANANQANANQANANQANADQANAAEASAQAQAGIKHPGGEPASAQSAPEPQNGERPSDAPGIDR